MTETVLVGLITGGVGIITAIFTHVVTWYATKKQCETQLQVVKSQNITQMQEVKIQADTQLKQSILRETYEARRKAFAELMKAETAYIKPGDHTPEELKTLTSAVLEAQVVASSGTASVMKRFLACAIDYHNRKTEMSRITPIMVECMQRDLIEFTLPTIKKAH